MKSAELKSIIHIIITLKQNYDYVFYTLITFSHYYNTTSEVFKKVIVLTREGFVCHQKEVGDVGAYWGLWDKHEKLKF